MPNTVPVSGVVMRTLTGTLEAAQKTLVNLAPVIALDVSDRPVELPRWDWTLSTEGVSSCQGAAALAADGALVRVRVKTTGDLQVARITDLAGGSWTTFWATLAGGYSTTLQAGIGAVTDGATVMIAYVNLAGTTIYYRLSSDYGATYGAETPLRMLGGADTVKGLAVCGGAGALYVAYIVDSGAAEPNDTVTLERYQVGIGWGLAATDPGHDTVTSCGTVLEGTVQRVILGGAAGLRRRDYDWNAGAWQAAVWLLQLGSTATGYTLDYPRLTINPDGSGRYYYTWYEKWTLTQPDTRYWFAASPSRDVIGEAVIPGTNLGRGWDLFVVGTSWYGVTTTCHYSAPLYTGSATQRKDLGADVTAFELIETGENKASRGRLWLRNADARYASPGTGTYAMLREGSRACLGLGYQTSAGAEKVWLPPMWVERWAHVDEGGEGYLVVELGDAWRYLDRCIARYQVTFSGLTYAQIAAKLLYRVTGATLASAGGLSITADPFTIKPGDSIGAALRRICDRAGVGLRFGTTAVGSDPGAWGAVTVTAVPYGSGASGYSFGPAGHKVIRAEYGNRAQKYNVFEVFGLGYQDWRHDYEHQKNAGHVFLKRETDWHLDSGADVGDRRERMYYDGRRALVWGWLECLPALGAELYDVVAVTDARAGMTAALRRVAGLRWVFDGRRGGKWQQRIELEAV